MKMTKSCGNVFLDLGFPPEEAESLLLRSEMMTMLMQIIEKRGLTPMKAAKLFGVDRSCVLDLKQGHIDKMDLDLLFAMLSRAGMHVKVEVSNGKRKKAA